MSSGFERLLTQPVFAGIRKRIARSLHYRTRQALACVCRNVLPLDETNVVVRLSVIATIRDRKNGVDEYSPDVYRGLYIDESTLDICLPSLDDHTWLAVYKYSECGDELTGNLYDRYTDRGLVLKSLAILNYKILTAASPMTRAMAENVNIDRVPVFAHFALTTYRDHNEPQPSDKIVNVIVRFRNAYECDFASHRFHHTVPRMLRACIPSDRFIDICEYGGRVEQAEAEEVSYVVYEKE